MMERKHLHGITLLGGLAMALLCGCIRDELEPCPPLRLSLEVADKNYVNSAAAARLGYEEERPEDLPFREYVSDLAYRVSDLETGRVVAERALSPVEGDAGSVEVPLPADLPYGSYVLTAWGNLAIPRLSTAISLRWGCIPAARRVATPISPAIRWYMPWIASVSRAA